jgi:hypothetical protein
MIVHEAPSQNVSGVGCGLAVEQHEVALAVSVIFKDNLAPNATRNNVVNARFAFAAGPGNT